MSIKYPAWLKTNKINGDYSPSKYGWDYEGHLDNVKDYKPFTVDPLQARKNKNISSLTEGLELTKPSSQFTGVGKAGITQTQPKGKAVTVPTGKAGIIKTEIHPEEHDTASAVLAGISNGVTLGAFNRIFKADQDPTIQKHKLAYFAGDMAGSFGPIGKLTKWVGKPLGTLGGKLIGKVAPKLVKPATSIIEGATTGAAFDTSRGVVEGDNAEQLKDRVKQGAIYGVGIDLGLRGLGKGIEKYLNWRNGKTNLQPIINEVKEADTAAKEVASTKQPLQVKGKLEVKNTALEKATEDYNNAIEAIHNHFKTNQLTPEEVARIKPELGIDLEKLVNNIETAKKPDLRAIGEKQRMSVIAGVNDAPKLKTTELTPSKVTPRNLLDQIAATKQPLTDGITSKSKIVSSNYKPKTSLKDSFNNSLNKFYTRFFDSNAPIKKAASDKTYILATNSKNAGGTVDYILKDGLVNREGKKIGTSLKEVIEDIPKGQENDFWNYMLHKHNVSRAAEGKNVYKDFDSISSAKAASELEKLHPEWKDKSKQITKWIDDFMQEWGVKAGTTDAKVYSELRKKYPDYLPTNRDFTELEEGIRATNGKGFVNQNTPISKATGSERDIIDPVENIMNLVNRTVRTAKYNEVGQNLLKEVRSNPEAMSKFAEIIEGPVNDNMKNIVTVLENGKQVNLKINNQPLLESLQGLYKSNVGDIEKYVKKATNIYKGLITQKNPVFAIRNIARDIPTAYVYGSEKNPLKFMKDLGSATKDVLKNTEVAQQYKALGAGGANFFNVDNPAKTAKDLVGKPGLLKNLMGGIEKFNNATETAPRLAEFKRTLEKTGDVDKAMFEAMDVTTNFSRGGDIAKKVDSYVPYFNAGLQGLDKMARQFKNKPLQTALKGVTAITLPAVLLNLFNKDNEDYKELDSRTKDNYYIFPDMNKDGKFIKIPKSRELGVLFGVIAERFLNQQQGQENAFKGFGNTVSTNFSPSNPIENNILSPLIYNIPKNRDFADRPIVPEYMKQDNRSPKFQYDEKTSEVAKMIGQITNLSPKEVDYLIRSYTGVIGQLLIPATTKANYNGNSLSNVVQPITSQFIADPLYSNKETTAFYDNMNILKQKVADYKITNPAEKPIHMTDTEWNKKKPRAAEEDLLKTYNKASDAMSDLRKQIKVINGNLGLDFSERRKQTKEIQEYINLIAKETNKLYKNSTPMDIQNTNDYIQKLVNKYVK